MAQTKSDNEASILKTYRLFHLLRQTTDAVDKLRETELKIYKITPEQAGALICIRSLGDKATPAELSRWLFRERNSMTVLLNRMHKLGLINKKRDAKRKNSIKLSLTKKGYQAYQHAIELRSFSSVIDVMSIKKREQLWALLQNIRLKILADLGLDPDVYSSILTKQIVFDSHEPKSSGKNNNRV
jgi:DNA-binding MarR family transcriptional regulator